jgi:hypothetical protein
MERGRLVASMVFLSLMARTVEMVSQNEQLLLRISYYLYVAIASPKKMRFSGRMICKISRQEMTTDACTLWGRPHYSCYSSWLRRPLLRRPVLGATALRNSSFRSKDPARLALVFVITTGSHHPRTNINRMSGRVHAFWAYLGMARASWFRCSLMVEGSVSYM